MTARYDPEDAAGARVKKPQGYDASHRQGTGRPAEYVAVTWVSEQLRDQIQRNGTSLAEAQQTAHTQARAPQPDLEAEQ
jgi:hypothetical protein